MPRLVHTLLPLPGTQTQTHMHTHCEYIINTRYIHVYMYIVQLHVYSECTCTCYVYIAYNICIGIDLGSCIHNIQFLAMFICLNRNKRTTIWNPIYMYMYILLSFFLFSK